MSKQIINFLLFCLLLCAQIAASAGQVKEQLLGFELAISERQYALEEQFDSLLDRKNLRLWMERLTAKPHQLGSPFGKVVA